MSYPRVTQISNSGATRALSDQALKQGNYGMHSVQIQTILFDISTDKDGFMGVIFVKGHRHLSWIPHNLLCEWVHDSKHEKYNVCCLKSETADYTHIERKSFYEFW